MATKLPRSAIAIFVFALFLGLLTSRYPLHYLYGIELFLLNAISWFVYKHLGYHHAFAVSFVGAVCGIFLFGQAPSLVFAPLEIMVVHLVLKRLGSTSILRGVFLYWLVFGLLLEWGMFQWLLESESQYAPLFLLFRMANGLINALLGEVAGDYLVSRISKVSLIKWRIERVSFQIFMVLLAIPFMIFLYFSGSFIYRDTVQHTSGKMVTIKAHFNETINAYSETELRDFKNHSSVQKAAIQEIFDSLTFDNDTKVILVGPDLQVIAAKDQSVKEGQTDYSWDRGYDVKEISNNMYLLQPQSIPEFNTISRWAASEYSAKMDLERLPSYSLFIREPVFPFQQSVFRLYTVSVSIAYVVVFAFAILALWASRKLSSSLTELADLSSDLPHKIRLRSSVDWRESSIYEVNRLNNNFKEMSDELVRMFHEINDSEKKLKLLVHYDSLTGLANRYSFGHYLPAVLQQSINQNSKAACLFIDLDKFKTINDTLGHEAGDAVLKAVGERLKRISGEQINSFRLAGDEFVVVLSSPLPTNLEAWAETVRKLLTEDTVSFGSHSIRLQLSAGLAIFPDHGHDTESLLRSADQAMYQAKFSGRNKITMMSVSQNECPQGGDTE